MSSGQRQSANSVTLTADEREIANASFKHLATEMERALAYDRNKRRMLGMKERGEIQGDG